MSSRILALLVLVIRPDAAFTGLSAFYLFLEWVVLDSSYQHYQKLAQVPTLSVRDLNVVQAAETQHRLKCFAERFGVLLSGVTMAVGLHGIYTLPGQRL